MGLSCSSNEDYGDDEEDKDEEVVKFISSMFGNGGGPVVAGSLTLPSFWTEEQPIVLTGPASLSTSEVAAAAKFPVVCDLFSDDDIDAEAAAATATTTTATADDDDGEQQQLDNSLPRQHMISPEKRVAHFANGYDSSSELHNAVLSITMTSTPAGNNTTTTTTTDDVRGRCVTRDATIATPSQKNDQEG